MCGSRPEPDDGDGVDGHEGVVGEAVLLAVGDHEVVDAGALGLVDVGVSGSSSPSRTSFSGPVVRAVGVDAAARAPGT